MLGDYPYIRAYCHAYGGTVMPVDGEVKRARQDDAPADSYAFCTEAGQWRTIAWLRRLMRQDHRAVETYEAIKRAL